jgi:hypothetical protein
MEPASVVNNSESKTTPNILGQVGVMGILSQDESAEYFYSNSIKFKVTRTGIEMWNSDTNTWIMLSKDFHLLHGGKTVLWNKYIIILGSLLPFQREEDYCITPLFFNTETIVMEPVPLSSHLRKNLKGFSTTVYDNKIYIFGGRTQSSSFFSFPSDRVFYFDCLDKFWYSCMHMPEARSFCTSKCDGDYINIIEGYSEKAKAIFRYCPKEDIWVILENSFKKRRINFSPST